MQSERVTLQNAQAVPSPTGWIGWIPLLVLPFLAIIFGFRLESWEFMWLLAVAIFGGLKWATWWQVRSVISHKAWRSIAYLFAWPGMDADAFLDASHRADKPPITEWLWASAKTTIGILLLWWVARHLAQPLAQGWVGLLGLVLLLHFGSFHLLALFWQSCGVVAQPIMAKPILSKTLSEFWGKRWNLGFRQLAHDLIFHPLHKRIGVGTASLLVFLVSGLIHDLVISLPARGGYGLPTAYFLLQGFGVSVERSNVGRRLGLQRGLPGWIFMFAFTAVPAFWLFHPAFVLRVIVPFMKAIGAL
ncbi:MAG TPA: MBOAT family protein [Terriglobales bacterium]|nr:MBOAT family protein [Terriglobales bacterium]